MSPTLSSRTWKHRLSVRDLYITNNWKIACVLTVLTPAPISIHTTDAFAAALLFVVMREICKISTRVLLKLADGSPTGGPIPPATQILHGPYACDHKKRFVRNGL